MLSQQCCCSGRCAPAILAAHGNLTAAPLAVQVEQPQSSDSDSDGSTSASDEDGGDDGRDGNGALAPAGDESGAASRQAKRKPAYSKSRAAALDLLQGAHLAVRHQSGEVPVSLSSTFSSPARLHPETCLCKICLVHLSAFP